MAGEKEVEVTRLGGNTMLAGHGKGGNEERPLPKPLPQKKPHLLPHTAHRRRMRLRRLALVQRWSSCLRT